MKRSILFSRCLLAAVLLAAMTPAQAADKVQWSVFQLTENAAGRLYQVSSVLVPDGKNKMGNFEAENMFDKKGTTCWCEGDPDDDEGAHIVLEVDEDTTSFHIINGMIVNEKLFKWNSRVSRFKAALYVAFRNAGKDEGGSKAFDAAKFDDESVSIKNSMTPQRLDFFFDWAKVRTFRDEVVSQRSGSETVVFLVDLEVAGASSGSEYDDLCITDLWFSNQTGD
jgi:opacity protein-like surface antigen